MSPGMYAHTRVPDQGRLLSDGGVLCVCERLAGDRAAWRQPVTWGVIHNWVGESPSGFRGWTREMSE
eukprot:6184349-Prymnesium_polylepis.1